MNKQEYIDWLKKVRNNQEEHSDMWYLVDEIIHESKKLENLLVPKEELTTKQVVEWAHNRCYKLVDCTFPFRTIKGDKNE